LTDCIPDQRSFLWVIDNADKLIRVNDAWLSFARENAAPGLTAQAVLDQPLWRFIADPETTYLYKQIFAKIRSGKSPVRIPFRCDSPECRRFMEMKLSLLAGDSIEFLSKILKLEFRDPVALLDPVAERSEESLKICSWCKKIFLPQAGWVEIEEAIRVLDLFAGPQFPQLTHGICHACLAPVEKELLKFAG
jgi:hypothetical protein